MTSREPPPPPPSAATAAAAETKTFLFDEVGAELAEAAAPALRAKVTRDGEEVQEPAKHIRRAMDAWKDVSDIIFQVFSLVSKEDSEDEGERATGRMAARAVRKWSDRVTKELTIIRSELARAGFEVVKTRVQMGQLENLLNE